MTLPQYTEQKIKEFKEQFEIILQGENKDAPDYQSDMEDTNPNDVIEFLTTAIEGAASIEKGRTI